MTSNAFTGLGVSNERMHEPSFIKSVRNTRGLISAMTLEKKVDLLQKVTKGSFNVQKLWELNPDFVGALEDIILQDFATEQLAMRTQGESTRGAELRAKMKVLPAVLEALSSQWMFQGGVDRKVVGKRILDLLAKFAVLSEDATHWYYFGIGANVALTSETNQMIADAVNVAFGNFTISPAMSKFVIDGPWKDSDYEFNTWAKQELETAKKQLIRNEWMQAEGKIALEKAITPVGEEKFSRDVKLVDSPAARVMSRGHYDRLKSDRAWVKQNQKDFEIRRTFEKMQIEGGTKALPPEKKGQ